MLNIKTFQNVTYTETRYTKKKQQLKNFVVSFISCFNFVIFLYGYFMNLIICILYEHY